ncbi:ATP phosphoribosyltransferase regulatory subunit [Salinibius halmophilus]|uniref:ATP phosphoribosyltransferase regulatory subunit n=1 Tax=Salinibius halmophilus TaxID=1853216 RepID=UPI001314EEE4|nr:ATP phosphoribosyltransferase regulatory subunit [Salinibius halmophilus]
MTIAERWLLPDGMEDVLPAEAARVEYLRRMLLDLWRVHGYQQVAPPPAEFLESLITGTSRDLDLQTFKLIDQLTGRQLGLSTDVTQQVARIDAHANPTPGPARYSYCKSVLRTRPTAANNQRAVQQIGCELFGSPVLNADKEIIGLLLTTLEQAESHSLTLDLGHMGVQRALLAQADLNSEEVKELTDMLRRRALPELAKWREGRSGAAAMLASLDRLSGGSEVIAQAKVRLAEFGDDIANALADLGEIIAYVEQRWPSVNIHIDLAEVRGWAYHTGLMFSVFAPAIGRPIAEGGRYDATGQVFGKARPATGFTIDLRGLVSTSPVTVAGERIFAAHDVPEDVVAQWRARGNVVVQALSDETAVLAGCTSELVQVSGEWRALSVDEARDN